MDWLILPCAAVLAFLAWKYPGRPRCADVCENLGKPSRKRRA